MDSSENGPLHAVSNTLGWLYFIAWSASFYPQVLLNWRRKSVQGLSLDFVYLNLVGFTAYAIYNTVLFCSEPVRRQYRERHSGEDSLVQLNDVVFGLHAVLFSIITVGQVFIYPRDSDAKRPWLAIGIIPLLGVGLCVMIGLSASGILEALDTFYYLSYVKLVCSFSKYFPQLYINFQRKSTVGWSIGNILLDTTGGVLSIVQEVLDAYLAGHWAGITGNVAKFALGVLTIVFDTAFIIQHYVLYPDRTDYYTMEDGGASQQAKSSEGRKEPADYASTSEIPKL
ncbi:cystinosin [Thamnocephalis sphaerospora]|uniref:Cystinosin n=1 Tax=Thamnocephalis sphaerospora TaxID=78915 RepID=A0A4V1IWB4_9FUNG|nr:cystinosin [Thamnocephalis sphaerospora]|eukprot:RKP06969.1 cystinosin [Thamnocephalis sphaerospora]